MKVSNAASHSLCDCNTCLCLRWEISDMRAIQYPTAVQVENPQAENQAVSGPAVLHAEHAVGSCGVGWGGVNPPVSVSQQQFHV